MNKEEALRIFTTYLQQAVEFSVEKAPEVLQQYVGLAFFNNAILFFICCILFIFCTMYYKKYIKTVDDEEYGFYIFMFSAFILLPMLILIINFLVKGLGIFLYPEGWLLEHFLH